MGEKLSAVFVLLLVSGAAAIAQNATSAFNDSSSVWYVADTEQFEVPGFRSTKCIEYSIAGDTIIGNEEWNSIQQFDHFTGLVTHKGFVRQDSVWGLYQNNSGLVDTLYNYSLQVGDSLVRYLPDILHVINVDSVFVSGQFVKRINFDTAQVTMGSFITDTWIEGFGSVHGPLAPLNLMDIETDHMSFIDSTRLACFENSNGVIWSNPNYSNFINTILQSTTELEGLNSGIQMTVLDNPVQQNGKFWVELHSRKPILGKRFDIYLHDELGRLVSTAQTRQGSLPNGNGQVELDAPSKPGLFQLSIMVEGERVASTKVLVL